MGGSELTIDYYIFALSVDVEEKEDRDLDSHGQSGP